MSVEFSEFSVTAINPGPVGRDVTVADLFDLVTFGGEPKVVVWDGFLLCLERREWSLEQQRVKKLWIF